jgi:hypothetical protein
VQALANGLMNGLAKAEVRRSPASQQAGVQLATAQEDSVLNHGRPSGD